MIEGRYSREEMINDVLSIMNVINKHLSENNCQHDIKQIAREAFGYEQIVASVVERPLTTMDIKACSNDDLKYD